MGVGRVTWSDNLFRVPVQNVLECGKFENEAFTPSQVKSCVPALLSQHIDRVPKVCADIQCTCRLMYAGTCVCVLLMHLEAVGQVEKHDI